MSFSLKTQLIKQHYGKYFPPIPTHVLSSRSEDDFCFAREISHGVEWNKIQLLPARPVESSLHNCAQRQLIFVRTTRNITEFTFTFVHKMHTS